MKILIIGGNGMLGHKLLQFLKLKFDVFSTVRAEKESLDKYNIFDETKTFYEIDITQIEKINLIINELKPDVIINAVGVIKQLKASKNVIVTLQTNSIFPNQLAEIAGKINSRLICISTDCVFNGNKGDYNEDDPPDAFDVYGKSKNLGEIAFKNCLTLRTSIIGRELNSKNSLVEWFLSNQGKQVNGYINAIYSGFPTIYLAEIIYDLIVNHKNLEGLYHVSSEPISKYDLLKLINSKFNANIEIVPAKDFYIDRSLNSNKFKKETGFITPDWNTLVDLMAADPTPYHLWK